MIEFVNIKKRYGAQEVLDGVSFRIHDGDRAGIVGPNGAGKSTLFSLIVGDLSPDRGDISLPKDGRIGYVRQQLPALEEEQSLIEYMEKAMPELQQIQHEMHAIEERLKIPDYPEKSADLRRMGALQIKFEHLGGYEIRNRSEAALCGLGFALDHLRRPFRSFSGGWQMRAELARVLVAQPETLLLDEPSNYLDLPAVEWLQRYLKGFAGTLLLVSHDRFLLNSLTTRTLEVAGGRVTCYPGNYTYYAEQKTMRHAQLLAGKKNQDRRREQVERFIERFRAKNTKSSQVQSRIKMLEKMEEVDVPEVVAAPGRIRLAEPPHCGHEVIRLEDAGITYNGEHWVLRHVDVSINKGEKVALVGLNGLGKTTLLRAMAGQLALNEGRRVLGHKVAPGYQSQEFAETMDPERTLYDTLKQASGEVTDREVRTMLGGFGFSGEAVEKRAGVLSGGEKIRLAFARLLIKPPNLLLLDEPTTHLDIASREALEESLSEYTGTLCLVSHDVEFVRRVAQGIIAMTPPGITRFAGGYDYYREKMALTAAPSAATPDPKREERDQRKAQKRERAVKIQVDARHRRALEKKIAEAETRLAVLEKEQQALVAQLSAPAAKVDYATVNQRLSSMQSEMAEVTGQWETASLELEQMAGRKAVLPRGIRIPAPS
ncbi:MAG: ABC-F family ATP-binding cassette domain-containing protein [Lentisphaerota bacterium]